MSKFLNKDGTLTAYALACGYIQTEHVGEYQVRLSHNGSSYDIRVWGRDTPVWVGDRRWGWEQDRSLGKARKKFRDVCALLEAGRYSGSLEVEHAVS